MSTKCSSVSFCTALSERGQEVMTTTVKGFIKHNFMSMATGEDSGSIMTYSMGKGDRGVALNFCPFCGFEFYSLYKMGKYIGESNGTSAGE